MPVGSDGGVHRVGVRGRRKHYPRAVSPASRVQDGGVELNDLHLRSHEKIGDCEQSTNK